MGYSDQKIRPAGGRRSPRAFEHRSDAAEKIIRMLRGSSKKKPRGNGRFRAFAKLNGEEKVEFLRRKLLRLYDQKLKACEEELPTDLIDRDIDRLEQQIQEIQIEMWE